jgi:hypothetical protein
MPIIRAKIHRPLTAFDLVMGAIVITLIGISVGVFAWTFMPVLADWISSK